MNEQKGAIEEGILQKYIFFKIAVQQSIKLIAWSNPWKIPMKKFNFSQVAGR